MTTHPSEDRLVLHHYGETDGSEEISAHLASCEACRLVTEEIRRMLEAVPDAPLPERGEDYGVRVWERIRLRLPAHRRLGAARRLWLPATLAASLVLAFLAGRHTSAPPVPASPPQPVRERILLIALGDHLERSQMVLAELVNAHASGPADVRQEQRWAEALLTENRLYRQAVSRSSETGVGSVLDELERVLLEVANGPSQLSAQELEDIQARIESKGILFKVRVVGRQVKQKSRRVLAETRVAS